MRPKPVSITKIDRSHRCQVKATIDPGHSLTDKLEIGNITPDKASSGGKIGEESCRQVI